jgi:hypothetical protein
MQASREEEFNAYMGYLQRHVLADSHAPEGLHELLRAVRKRAHPPLGKDGQTSQKDEPGSGEPMLSFFFLELPLRPSQGSS